MTKFAAMGLDNSRLLDRKMWSFVGLVLVLALPASLGFAEPFDIDAATRAYLDQIPAATRLRSDAYYTGGYWLILMSWLVQLSFVWLLVQRGWSAKIREQLHARIPSRFVRTAAFGAIYILASAVLTFPWAFYEGFYREHQYGFATQTFGPWMLDQSKGFLLTLVFGPWVMSLFYWVVRRLGELWWMAGTALCIGLATLLIFVGPLFIEPLFNTYQPMAEGPVKTEVMRIARANSIPAQDVFMVDASRQTNRVSANVAGIGSTVRIALNDNLLNRSSPAGIAAVMGHEMGHYVLNHVAKSLIYFVIIIALGFGFVHHGFRWIESRWGHRTQTQGIADEAGFPIVLALFSTFMFLATPLNNSLIRTQESEADFFGLNASRQPDGFAEAMLLTAEYRKAEPLPWEEILFYDHPSPKTRIRHAMQWKAENLP